MKDNEQKILKHNLDKSKDNVKQYYVRVKNGFMPYDQIYMDMFDIPVDNGLKNKKTSLGELISDIIGFKSPIKTK